MRGSRAALAVCAALVGCGAHRTEPEASHPVEPPPIALCKTTETDLRAAMGAPTRDGLLRDARVLSWITGITHDGVVRYLAVLLDGHGVVVDRIWNLPTEIVWVPTDQCTRPGSP